MKKIIFTTSFLLLFLFFTDCAKQPNLTYTKNSTPEQVSNEVKKEIPFSVQVEMPLFDYPLGWQIISMTDIEQIQPYKNSAKETFGTNILGYRITEINFDRPHDIGPYDGSVDIQIQDLVFELPPTNPNEYLAKIESAWGVQGTIEDYTSPTGLNFAVWQGNSPAYEADLVLYVTQYTDKEGQKHFVEISRMGSDHKIIKNSLKPVIDSLKF